MQGLTIAQLQLLGIGVEVGLEVWNGHTVGVLIVNTQATAHVDVLYTNTMTLKLVLQLIDTITEGFEVAHIQYLTTNVEVQADHFDVLHLRGFLNDFQHVLHVDAKLILCQTSSDISMRMSAYIGIQTESHTSHLALGSSQFVDDLQFRDALHVEAEDVVVQSEVNLPVALADTGINNLLVGEPSLDAGFYLATTDAVSTQASLTDNLQHLGVGIGLDSIVHTEAFVLAGLLIDGAKRLT